MYQQGNDSQRPLADGYPNDGYGYDNNVYPIQKKKTSTKKWIIIGGILLVIAAGVGIGVYFGTKKDDNATSSGGKNGGGRGGGGGNGGDDQDVDPENLEILATATNSWLVPEYPSVTDTAAFEEPTFLELSADEEWPQDDFAQANPSLENLRPHPRLIAPQYKWDALPGLIEKNAYLADWHESILANATAFYDLPVVAHVFDGGPSGSGILDPARETKLRIKFFAYAYRMTSDTRWVDRAYRELLNASGNGDQPFGEAPDNWNTAHFLDTAEMTAAFAIAYDWLYDVWTTVQRDLIRDAIVNLGLNFGLLAHTGDAAAGAYSWWRGVNGNWNCVSNGGLIMGALAVMEDDTTGTAAQLLPLAVENAQQNCVRGPSTDGTWSETPNYWYFGTTGHAELTSALMTATGGGDFGMLNTNPGFALTGLYHIYVNGMTSKFEYGDHGPNKFSTTANSLLFYGTAYDRPLYQLFQRDRHDAAEPWSMFWYDPSVSGAFWNGLPLDHVFEDPTDSWASFRSSWTDNDGTYIGFKASELLEHQAHGDLDAGTFVFDALNQRWAGEHGNADYLGRNYFSNETQESERWLIYRKMTEGQNVIAINGQNQDVTARPTIRFDTSGTVQDGSTTFQVPEDSTAFIVADLATAYFGAAIKRGIRFINGRRQMLLQDELTDVQEPSQWRVQTNATITVNDPPTSATLELGGKRLTVHILEGPEGAGFLDLPSARTANAPQLNAGLFDEDNSPARVLAIDIPAGTTTLVVAWNPEWEDFDDFKTPATVPLDDWSLDSHN